MIPTATRVLTALAGAARLARFQAGGLSAFDTDARAFVESFFAAALAAPGYVVLVLFHLQRTEPEASTLAVVLVQGLAYVISWTAFPALAHELARLLDRGERWMGFVVALNWSKVIQMAVYVPLIVLANSGLVGEQSAAALSLAALTVILIYQWFVTRAALAVHGAQAAGLTGFDLIIGITITAATEAALTP